MFGAALGSLDRAQISTIHAFCQALLRSYAAEAGVDPDFTVHDVVMTERRRQEKWRVYLETLGDDAEAVARFDRVLSLGLGSREIEKLALELAGRADLAEVLGARPLAATEPAWPALEALRGRLTDVMAWCTDPGDRLLLERLEPLAAIIDALMVASGSDREATLATFAGQLTDKWGAGQKGNWAGNVGRARETGKQVTLTLLALLAGLRSAALADVMPYVVAFVRGDENERGLDGTLTFDDLILQVRGLMRTSADARRSLRGRYDALLIDEFQDTDPLQVEIATAFATDPDSGRAEAGRLFVVGDPKQSIYRFRRADMAVYADTKGRMQAEGAGTPELALNKRSRREILDWVNRVFERVIGAGGEPAVQPPYRPIHAEREVALDGPGIAWFGGQTERNARETRAEEAEAIAALCRQAVERDAWQVQERDGEVRAARYRDVAVLIPRRTGLVALERALVAARIPYRVEGGSLIYRTQELRDLINCLTSIDDPADEVATVAALRSPAFACSDADLLRFKAGGGRFDYTSGKLEERTGPVAEGLRVLAEYHAERHEMSQAALVESFTAQCGQVETGILDQGDRNAFRRVRYLAQQARTFESAGPESLRTFVSWLERQAKAQILDNEGAGVDDDEDAVRILTVHGAKGLEFPIVVLAGLSAAPNRSFDCYLRDYSSETVAVRAGTSGGNRLFTLGDYEHLWAEEGEHESAEFDRVLYVGATRARDHLVVSLYHPKSARDSAAQRLTKAGATDDTPELTTEPESPGSAGPPVRGDDGRGAERHHRRRVRGRPALRWSAARRGGGSRARRRSRRQAPPEDDQPEREDDSEPWSRGRAATRLGRAVHATIQSLPLDADDATIAAFSRAQAVAEAVPERAGDVQRLVRWVLRESEAWRRATGAARVMREVPFALETDGTVLEGFIDLVIDDAGRDRSDRLEDGPDHGGPGGGADAGLRAAGGAVRVRAGDGDGAAGDAGDVRVRERSRWSTRWRTRRRWRSRRGRG